MSARVVVIASMLLACEHERDRERPSPPEERCLADEIGNLKPGWEIRDDCESERARCRDACLDGDGDACFNLAITIQVEDGDDERVDDYFARACRAGLAPGCTNWGAGQWFRDTPSSWRCLYRVFERSCNVGEPFGCSMTARLLIESPRTPADPWIGYSQLSNACDKYEGPPCRFLALYIERGMFGAPDAARVKALLVRACRGDDEDACGQTSAEATMLP